MTVVMCDNKHAGLRKTITVNTHYIGLPYSNIQLQKQLFCKKLYIRTKAKNYAPNTTKTNAVNGN